MVSFCSYERLERAVVDRSDARQGRQRDLPECTGPQKKSGKRAKVSAKCKTVTYHKLLEDIHFAHSLGHALVPVGV